MFTAILWDYDGTLANTPVKNIAVTRAVLGRLDPALLDPLPEALSSLAAYQAANYRWRNWRELYQHALRVPADRLDEAGALWGPCQLADRTLPPLFGGLLEVLPRLAALAPMGICSQNDSGNIRAALAAHGAADCFAAVVGHADVDFARQKPDPAAFLACLDRLGLREGASPTSGTTPGTSPSAAMPRRPCGPWAGRRRWSAWPPPGAAPRPWIWRRRTPWPPAPRTCRICWQTCDTTAAPPGSSRRGRCLPAGGFCLCFVFWCAMIF